MTLKKQHKKNKLTKKRKHNAHKTRNLAKKFVGATTTTHTATHASHPDMAKLKAKPKWASGETKNGKK